MASTIRTMMLEVGGISVPVALRGASERKDVSFDTALKIPLPLAKDAKPEAEREYEYRARRQLYVPDPGDAASLTIDPLRRDKKGKVEGIQYDYELVKGIWDGDRFIEIEPAEIEEIDRLTMVDPLSIQEFVPLSEVAWERTVASYFLVPANNTGTGVLRALATLKETLTEQGVAGVGKLMPKSRQKLVVVYPKHGGLMVTCLAYADTFKQVIEGAASLDGVEVNADVKDLLTKLVQLKTQPIEVMDEYRDDSIELRADLIERVKMGESIIETDDDEAEVAQPRITSSPDALMEVLKASIAEIEARRAQAVADEAKAAVKSRKKDSGPKAPRKGSSTPRGRVAAKS